MVQQTALDDENVFTDDRIDVTDMGESGIVAALHPDHVDAMVAIIEDYGYTVDLENKTRGAARGNWMVDVYED